MPEIMIPLTEHGLQSDQTTHKAIEIHRQIRLRISGDNQLMQGVAQFETWGKQ